jgi:hypothetical protein
MRHLAIICAVCTIVGCDSAERRRTAAERVAGDTVAQVWRRAASVDSVLTRGDTTIVWLSPTNWTATDAPQAGVRVGPAGHVLAVQWVTGG